MTADTGDGRPLFRLLAWAMAIWIGASVLVIVWFFTTTPEPGLAAFGIPFVAWAIGYVPGGVGLLLVSGIQVARARATVQTAVWAVLVYFLPAVLIALALQLPGWAAPLSSAEGDFGGLAAAATGPLLVVLYLAGLAAGYAVRERSLGRTVAAIVAPPLAGLLLAAAWSAAAIVRSPEARAAGSMAFAVEQVELAANRVTADGVFTLEQPGAYLFSAIYLEFRGGSSGGRATITWPDGAPAAAGRYRCRLVFDQVTPDPDADSRLIIFEVRADSGETYDPPVAEFRIPIEATVKTTAGLAAR